MAGTKTGLLGDVASAKLDALQPAPPITLRTLALRCGTSPSTASRALSGHPNVREALRERILGMASRHGYHRNHLVSGVMSHVRAARTQRYVGNLAIVHVPSREQPSLLPMQGEIIAGASGRAKDLGYQIEVFTLGSGANALASLGRVLRARGIVGVIFLQSNSNDVTAEFPSRDFAVVQIDYDSPSVMQHTISLDHHFTLIGALTRLRERGYRRLGLFIERHKDDRLINKWTAAFRSFQENQGGIGSVPVLKMEKIERTAFVRWCDRHRPDLVVGHVDHAIGWLKKSGRPVPIDIGFFNLNWNERNQPCAGLDLQPAMHGSVAV
ncbi:MAG: LacI family DNA-binding transcriptional regulator, partial [Opitutus sp.]